MPGHEQRPADDGFRDQPELVCRLRHPDHPDRRLRQTQPVSDDAAGRQQSVNQVLATNDIVLPVSDEMNCRLATCPAPAPPRSPRPVGSMTRIPGAIIGSTFSVSTTNGSGPNHAALYAAALATNKLNPAGLYRLRHGRQKSHALRRVPSFGSDAGSAAPWDPATDHVRSRSPCAR